MMNKLQLEADSLAYQYQRGEIDWLTYKVRLDHAIEVLHNGD